MHLPGCRHLVFTSLCSLALACGSSEDDDDPVGVAGAAGSGGQPSGGSGGGGAGGLGGGGAAGAPAGGSGGQASNEPPPVVPGGYELPTAGSTRNLFTELLDRKS